MEEEVLSRKSLVAGIAVASMLVAAAPALAQPSTSKLDCLSTGSNAPEPLGDREGHAIQVSTATCKITGGLMDGAVVTQHTVWEIDKGTFTTVSGDNVARKPGALMVSRPTTGTLTMRMEDGRPTGWTATGKGVVAIAVGGAAPLAGKAYSWSGRATGPRDYVIEVKYD
jgi:hypothetical protein